MLEKSNLPIPLNAPMDTKVDEKLTNQEIFLLHQNTRFQKIGSLIKRNGYEDKSPSASLSIKKCLNTSNGLLALCEPLGETSAAYRSFDDAFVQTSPTIVNDLYTRSLPVEFSGRNIAGSSYGVVHTGYDRYEDIEVFVTDFFGSSFGQLTVFDSTTGTSKSVYLSAYSTRSQVRIFEKANGTKYITVIYQDTGASTNLIIATYDINLVLVMSNTVTNMTGSTLCRTLERYNEGVAILYKGNTAATNLRILQVNETGIVQNSSVTAPVNVKSSCTCQMDISGTQARIVYMRDNVTVDDPRFFGYSLTLLAIQTTDREIPLSSRNYTRVNFATYSAGKIGVSASVLINGSSATPITDFAVHTFSGSTTTAFVSMPIVTTMSDMRQYASDKVVCVGTSLGLDPLVGGTTAAGVGIANNMYIMTFTQSTIEIVGVFNNDAAPAKTVLSFGSLNANLINESSIFYSACLRLVRIVRPNSSTGEQNACYGFNFNATTDNYQSNFITKLGQNHFISSGLMLEYDGNKLFRNGFLTDCGINAIGSTAGASIAAGTYKVIALYEFYDANGQRSQSAPSESKTIVLGGAVGSIDVDVFFPIAGKSTIKIVLYCTLDGGNTYYRTTSYTVEFYLLIATINITALPTGIEEQLYTTGGVLPNDTPSPSKYLVSHQERIFSIDADYPNQISYTKKTTINGTAEWSDFFKLYLSASDIKRDNELVGLASLNEKLIILRKSSLYYIVGDGPNVLGEQNNFTEPELISSDVGCIEPQSIVASPAGIMFKTAKGIYLLDPSLGTSYIGSPVEDYNSEEIIASTLIENKNIVMFMTTSRILVYDYMLSRWSVDDIQGISLAAYDDKPVIVKSSNVISFESTDYADVFGATTTGIVMLVETGWIKTSGIQDFGRIVYALILGKYKSSHTLKVDVYYDYNDTISSTYDLTHNVLQTVYQFRIQLKKQKCEAIKLRIYDVPVSQGESCELTNLTLELGIKKGVYKTQQSRNY